ncbi:MAG: LamG domain-containing protein, partial [Phycisphaerae bacterium]|nr:LamG domain-containing protein [Phycisphaerae bacterium]
IGFGDTTTRGQGTVYFEDIQIYATRCALVERDADFVPFDYAPAGAPAGDCVIDYLEIEAMADAWLDRDALIATRNPSLNGNPVVYYPLNEGDGNRVHTEPNETKWIGTTWNDATTPPSHFGTTWATPGYDGNTLNPCIYMAGLQGSRVQCGTTFGDLRLGFGAYDASDANAMTLSAWVRWLGPRYWDDYLRSKAQGILGKRRGWDNTSMVWMLEVDTNGQQGGFAIRSRNEDVYSADDLMMRYINQWVHVAVTYANPPNPVQNPEDANSQARLYFNGGQVNTGPWHFSRGDDANIFLTIGVTQDQNAWPNCPEAFYGYIDEVRIYDRCLEPNEVAYLADLTPLDGSLWVPIPSSAEVYDANETPPYIGEQAKGQRRINFKDFALLVDRWLTEQMYPR